MSPKMLMDNAPEVWPFSSKPLERPSFLQRLLRRQPIENAVIAVNNLLAERGGIADLRPQQFTEVLGPFHIDPKKLRSAFEAMLTTLVVFVLENVDTAQVEAERQRLASLFPLDGADIESAVLNARGEVYGRAVDRFIDDGRLSKQEKIELEDLRSRLGLPEENAKRIYANCAQRRISRFIQFITEDQRISPIEDKRLAEMAASLGVTLNFDETSGHVFDRYRTLWAVENAELPEVSVSIPLRKGEVCHFTSECSWHEYRVTSTTVTYGGFRYSARVVKGLSAVGGIREYRPVRQESLVPVDDGAFYITNSRVLFVGGKKGLSIPLSGIVEVSMFSDGLMLRRDSGKNPFISFHRDVDICSMILARLVGQ